MADAACGPRCSVGSSRHTPAAGCASRVWLHCKMFHASGKSMLSAWQQEVKKPFQQTQHHSKPQAGKVKVPPSTHQSQGSSPGGCLHYLGGSGTAKGAATPSHFLWCFFFFWHSWVGLRGLGVREQQEDNLRAYLQH